MYEHAMHHITLHIVSAFKSTMQVKRLKKAKKLKKTKKLSQNRKKLFLTLLMSSLSLRIVPEELLAHVYILTTNLRYILDAQFLRHLSLFIFDRG